MIGAGAGGDEKAERREEAEDVGSDGVAAVAEHGGDGGTVVGVGGRELVQGKRRVV